MGVHILHARLWTTEMSILSIFISVIYTHTIEKVLKRVIYKAFKVHVGVHCTSALFYHNDATACTNIQQPNIKTAIIKMHHR